MSIEAALEHHKQGNLQLAAELYQQTLNSDPDNAQANHLLGLIAHQLGNNTQAITLIEKSIALNASHASVHFNLARVYESEGSFVGAHTGYQKAIAIKPEDPHIWQNLGIVKLKLKQTQQAIACFEQVLSLSPPSVALFNNTGNIFKDLGYLSGARKCFQQAIALKPDVAVTYYNLGNTYAVENQCDQAVACFQKALEYNPKLTQAYNNIGTMLKDQRRFIDAIKCYQQAIQLQPDFALAQFNLGLSLEAVDQFDAATRHYQQAYASAPTQLDISTTYCHHLQQRCDWTQVSDLQRSIHQQLMNTDHTQVQHLGSPFATLGIVQSEKVQKKIAQKRSEFYLNRARLTGKSFSPKSKSHKHRLTLGFVSNDFFDHATLHLMIGVFRNLNRQKFNVICFSYGRDDQSHYRKNLMAYSKKFIDITEQSDTVVAQWIVDQGIDILIDLKGHTKDSRLGIFALKPAPVQITYLGYPGTTGAEFFDYLIADKVVAPISHIPYFSEKIVYLPNTYLATDNQQIISQKKLSRAQFGLPEAGFVFCSFNQAFKIDRDIFSVWMRLLESVKQSVLWLQTSNHSAQENLHNAAATYGIKPERIIFTRKLTKSEHLKRLQLADLALDTTIVNGHTTTVDALWTGLPVLTLQGTYFAARVSASLLQAIGLPELITDNRIEYENVGRRIATDETYLANLKHQLQTNKGTMPLFNTEQYTNDFERLLWEIYDNQK